MEGSGGRGARCGWAGANVLTIAVREEAHTGTGRAGPAAACAFSGRLAVFLGMGRGVGAHIIYGWCGWLNCAHAVVLGEVKLVGTVLMLRGKGCSCMSEGAHLHGDERFDGESFERL